MFGYVKPYRPSLVAGDYEFYRAVYCGVCRSMKRLTGPLTSFSLSYDFVFLALVRLLCGENHVRIVPRRCIAHPLRRRPMLTDSAAVDYAARVSAILIYYKLLDDKRDKRFLGKLPPAAALSVFSRARRRAALPELDERIAAHLAALSEAEKQGVASVDIPAGIFGELLGDIFAYDAPQEHARALWELGNTVGRFVYAADAAEDFEDDLRSGNYNPYVRMYGGALTPDARRDIHDALLCILAEGEAAWKTLPFGETVTMRRLMENILYDGLPRRIAFLLTGEKRPSRTPRPYDGVLP